MNDAQLRILFVFTDLILPLVLGYYLHQRSIISDRLCNRLISFNIIWICTLLSLLSFWVLPLTAELLWLPAFSFIFAAIPGIISVCTFARRHKEPLDRGAYIISSLLANIGTLGGLCAFILYGETGFAYVEINPFTFSGRGIVPLDMVAKLDDAEEYWQKKRWSDLAFPEPFGRTPSKEELFIKEIDSKTGASRKLTILNPEGRVWTMVAGGGASVIYADTICDLGHADEMANYGEYSGDPNTEEGKIANRRTDVMFKMIEN